MESFSQYSNPRSNSPTQWRTITLPLYVNTAGTSFLTPMVFPRIPRLFVIRISATHTGNAVAGGNTTIAVHNFAGGVGNAIASLVMPTAMAAWAEATATYVDAEVPLDTGILMLTVATDGGHRQIWATAYLQQVPLRG